MADIDTTDLEPMLETVWQLGGSDLLLTVGSAPLCRVNGELEPLDGWGVLDSSDTERLILGCLTAVDRQRLHDDRELDFSFSWRALARMRGNVFYQRQCVALALRLIPSTIPTPLDLGIPEAVVSLTSLPQGLLLVTGPTGSGKSTTQAALIDHINRYRKCHVVTIEDPIEYVHTNKLSAVNQREVGDDTHSFERALRSALREDPDVLLIGEMRDPDSIQTALTIAETGHLVFATLHTNDTATALDRIVDVFPTDRQAQIRVQLAASLVGVVAQRLVPALSGTMVAAYEVMIATSAVRNLIRDGKSAQIRNVLLTNQREGMQTLEMALNALVADGTVTYDDAVSRSLHPKEIKIRLAPLLAPPSSGGDGANAAADGTLPRPAPHAAVAADGGAGRFGRAVAGARGRR